MSDATIRVLLFSVLRELVGERELTLALPDPPTGEEVLNRLETRCPGLAEYRSVIRLAVNEGYVSEDVELNRGDEIALITPVSGG